jgi:peptidoglycan/xylan/chitin deacetylase (PgdA/CDA1 family)
MRVPTSRLGGSPACRVASLVFNDVSALLPIPDKLVVLTFDDSVKSHYTIARPILKRYGFSATFFIIEGFTFKTNKTDYMT